MATISYIAVLCANPAALAAFYTGYFGFEEMGRSAEGDISLTDGAPDAQLILGYAATF